MTAAARVDREQSLRELEATLDDLGRHETARRFSIILRRTALDLLRRIVNRTPVATGRARANWQVTIGAPAEGVLEAFDKSSKGSQTVQAGSAVIGSVAGLAGLGIFPVLWISNNLPYIVVLEEGGYPNPSKKELRAQVAARVGGSTVRKSLRRVKGKYRVIDTTPKTSGGFSRQAPNGMVAVSLQEVLQELRTD